MKRGGPLLRRQRKSKTGAYRAIPPTVVTLVTDRSGGSCERCGNPLRGERGVDWSIHHRKNRSQGGRNVASNLLVLCGDGSSGCHGWVTEHPALAGDEGTHVPSWLDPAEVPVTTLGRTVWLADDGGVSGQAPEEAAS